MIAIDTSALIAILLDEPETDAMLAAIAAADIALIGRPTAFELHLVATGKSRPTMTAEAAELIGLTHFTMVDFDAAHLTAATGAFDRFGKGRHPASLNFGDCMSYAVAAVAGCPLLYKGQDFALTDIRSAL